MIAVDYCTTVPAIDMAFACSWLTGQSNRNGVALTSKDAVTSSRAKEKQKIERWDFAVGV